MRRHAFGMIGVIFLAAAAVGFYKTGIASAEASMAISVCLRVGLVFGAIWLAYPQLKQLAQRVPPWMIACIALAMLILVVRPKAIFALAPILAAIAVLQFVGWLFKPLPQKKRSVSRAGKAKIQKPD